MKLAVRELSVKDEAAARKDKLRLILRSGHNYTERFAEAVASIIPRWQATALMRAMYGADRDLIPLLLNHDRFKTPVLRQQYLVALLDVLTPKEMQTLDDKPRVLRKAISELREASVVAAKLASNQSGWKWVRELPAKFSNLDSSAAAADLRQMVEWGCLALNLKMLHLLCQTMDPGNQSDRVWARPRYGTELYRRSDSRQQQPQLALCGVLRLAGNRPLQRAVPGRVPERPAS